MKSIVIYAGAINLKPLFTRVILLRQTVIICLLALSTSIIAAPSSSSDPQFYGRVFISALDSYGYDDGSKGLNTDPHLFNIYSEGSASYFGIKGELPTDIKAISLIYVLEWQTLYGSSDSNNFGQKNQYIGLKSFFGELTMGRQDTALKKSQGKVDIFGDYIQGDIKYYLNGENRLSNSFGYKSASLWHTRYIVTVSQATSDQTASDPVKFGTSHAVVYDNKNLDLYAAIAVDKGIAGSANKINNLIPALDIQRFVAQYTISGFKLGLLTQQSVATKELVVEIDNDKFRSTMINLQYSWDAFNFKIQLATSDEKSNKKSKISGDAEKIDVTLAGVDYKLSENTQIKYYYSYKKYHYASDYTGEEDTDHLSGVALFYKF